jgi:ORF6N domain
VNTKRFNEAFKRNRPRFPDDFAFQLTVAEFEKLRSQLAPASSQAADSLGHNWSQFATGSSLHRSVSFRPWAFTALRDVYQKLLPLLQPLPDPPKRRIGLHTDSD